MLLLISATMAGSAAARPFVEPRVPIAPMSETGELRPGSYAQERYFLSAADIVAYSSRVGRGKSYIACGKQFVKGLQLPGLKMALTRLERASMDNSVLETLRDKVIPAALWQKRAVGGNRIAGWAESDSTFYFPPVRCPDCGRVHQSKIVATGLLDPGRLLSTEWGDITVDQAEQLDAKHDTFIRTRLRQMDGCIEARAARQGLNPRQLHYLFNPADDQHWAALAFDPDAGMRCFDVVMDSGKVSVEVILSAYHDNEGQLPPNYNASLEALKGSVFYDRLVLGKWARAEGLVFPMYSPAIVVPRPAEWAAWGGYPPPDWPRWRGCDFGWNNPFVFLWIATDPVSGVDWVYQEWSRSEMLVEDHARKILTLDDLELKSLRESRALSDDPSRAFLMKPYLDQLYIRGTFADHDREDAATLARHGVRTTLARKDIDNGIKAVIAILGADKLRIVADAIVDGENPLEQRLKLPTSLAKEMSRYTWQKQAERSRNPNDQAKEKPVDAGNHRIDALRYFAYSRAVTPRPSAWVAA